ncbi:MAG: NAD(+) diphosphatase [Nocardioidaceae bacterium]
MFDEQLLRTPGFTFSRSRHDRMAQLRVADDWLDELWAVDDAVVLVVGDGQVAMDGDRLRRVRPAQAPAGDRAVLGRLRPGGPVQLAVMVPEVPRGLGPVPAREAGGRLDAEQGSLLVHALGLANWHQTHPRCARCGSSTDAAEAGHVRRCPSCGSVHFPRTDPAVIMLVTDDDDRALLGRQPGWPAGRFSTLAGFVEPGESLEDAVRREVLEEVGVVVTSVTYAASQPWPFPASMMVGFFARAASPQIDVDGQEIEEAAWFTRADLTERAAAGDLSLPGVVSISRWLIQAWHGGELAAAP